MEEEEQAQRQREAAELAAKAREGGFQARRNQAPKPTIHNNNAFDRSQEEIDEEFDKLTHSS